MMETKEAVEILKKYGNNEQVPTEVKDALQTLMPDLDRLIPSVPTKGRQGSYMTYSCGYCHTGISSGSRYCYRCGHKVDLENSDIPAVKEDVLMESKALSELPEEEKRSKTKYSDVEGQQSIFDIMDGDE